MCSPEYGQLAVQGVGAVSAANTARNQTGMNRQAYAAQASIQANNAKLSEWQAQDALSRGDAAASDALLRGREHAADVQHRGQQDVLRVRGQTAKLKGRQVATFAGRGVAVDSESAQNIYADTDMMGDADAATIAENAARDVRGITRNASREATDIKSNAAREAWGRRVEGVNYRGNAGNLRTRARFENPGAAFTGSLISGAAGVAGKWYDYKAKGAFDTAPSTTRVPQNNDYQWSLD